MKPKTHSGTVRKLKIGGMVIDVLYRQQVTKESDCIGLCVAYKNRIVIEKGLEQQKRAETILHELLHWISENYSLGMSEKTVNTLALVLIDLICQNKPFIKTIMKGVQK